MTSHIIEIHKLKNIESSINRAVTAIQDHFKKATFFGSCELFEEAENFRKTEINKLDHKIRNVYNPLCELKLILKRKDIDNIDLLEFKNKMIFIQNGIEDLKQQVKQEYISLQKDEGILTNEVEMYECQMEKWSTSLQNCANFEPKTEKRKVSSTPVLPSEIQDFVKFVEKSGGHENGWTSEDHQLFLKIRAKYKTIDEVAKFIHKLLPDISEEEVVEHEQWYIQYCELKEKQKMAIMAWKSAKKNALKTEYKEYISPQSRIKTRFVKSKDVKEDLAIWKVRKETIRKEQEKQELEQKIKQKELEKYKRERMETIKKEIRDWKAKRRQESENENLIRKEIEIQEKEHRVKRANMLIKQFQSQDNVFVQKKLQMLNYRAKSADKILESNNKANRDPERLLKPTKQWLSRTNSLPTKSSTVCDLQNIKRLGLPTWRKGVTS